MVLCEQQNWRNINDYSVQAMNLYNSGFLIKIKRPNGMCPSLLCKGNLAELVYTMAN